MAASQARTLADHHLIFSNGKRSPKNIERLQQEKSALEAELSELRENINDARKTQNERLTNRATLSTASNVVEKKLLFLRAREKMILSDTDVSANMLGDIQKNIALLSEKSMRFKNALTAINAQIKAEDPDSKIRQLESKIESVNLEIIRLKMENNLEKMSTSDSKKERLAPRR